ncbi:hypothetical protein [Mesorhizobium sp. ORM16]|uniref:hypothetical protein n=1 Tax=Mesorhizobium sp. ORM16 TaxID=3376989 RepID=UPI0038578786
MQLAGMGAGHREQALGNARAIGHTKKWMVWLAALDPLDSGTIHDATILMAVDVISSQA